MKKLMYLIIAITVLGLIVTGCGLLTVPPSEQNELGSVMSKTGNDDHKIRNKWDLKGSFVGWTERNWGDLAEEATWEYSIHIKEAMNGDYSVGSIRFTTGDIEVVGHVKQTKNNYLYWEPPNLAAAGWAEYDGEMYNFLFLYRESKMWFALTLDSIDSFWLAQTVMFTRAYQLHSKSGESFTFIPKIIHE